MYGSRAGERAELPHGASRGRPAREAACSKSASTRASACVPSGLGVTGLVAHARVCVCVLAFGTVEH